VCVCFVADPGKCTFNSVAVVRYFSVLHALLSVWVSWVVCWIVDVWV